jgi:hypothetical protein
MPGAQILVCEAVDVFELLNDQDQEVTLEDTVESGSKAPLKKLRKLSLSLSLRNGP